MSTHDAQGDQSEVAARRERLRRAGNLAWTTIGLAGALVIVGYVVGRLSLIVVPVILALFPATLLVPVSVKLKEVGLPNTLAAVASIVLGLAVIAGIIGAMIPLVVAEVPNLIESASSGVEQIETFLEEDPFGLGLQGPSELLRTAREQLGGFGDYTDQAMSAATTAFEVAAGLVLLFVVLFFYLKDGRRLMEGVVSLAPRSSRSRVRSIVERAWDTLGRYFRGQMVVALVDAVFIGIGLLILGIPLAAPLSVLIFFGALFPLVGAVVTGALAVLVALAHGGLATALLVLGLILLVQQVEGNVLQPLILGRAIDLHPLVVLLSVTAGGVTFGILGAFLAVPVAAIVARTLLDDDSTAASDDPAEYSDDGDRVPDTGTEGRSEPPGGAGAQTPAG
jgi:putative heme transporter